MDMVVKKASWIMPTRRGKVARRPRGRLRLQRGAEVGSNRVKNTASQELTCPNSEVFGKTSVYLLLFGLLSIVYQL